MLTLYVTYSEGGPWEVLYLSGSSLFELRMRGEWGNRKVYAIKYPDGRIWDFKLHNWRKENARL